MTAEEPPAPELQPVTPGRRRGLDRGVLVIAAIVVFVGVALAKPWGADTDHAPEVAHEFPSPTPTVRPTPRPVVPEPTLSLDGVTATLAGEPRAADEALVMTLWRPNPVSLEFRAVMPAPEDLGANCEGGALLGAGTDAIGLTLPDSARPSRLSRVVLRRLFRGLSSVSLPVRYEHDDANAVALIAPDGVDWAPGYYALTVDALGNARTLPICVGNMIRLVDYSLVTYMPAMVDSAAARSALLGELGRR